MDDQQHQPPQQQMELETLTEECEDVDVGDDESVCTMTIMDDSNASCSAADTTTRVNSSCSSTRPVELKRGTAVVKPWTETVKAAVTAAASPSDVDRSPMLQASSDRRSNPESHSGVHHGPWRGSIGACEELSPAVTITFQRDESLDSRAPPTSSCERPRCDVMCFLVVTTLINPVFGLFAILLRSSQFPELAAHNSRVPRTRRLSNIVAATGVLVTVAVCLTVRLMPNCRSTFGEMETFPFRHEIPIEQCQFGAYCDGSCYYNSRANRTGDDDCGNAGDDYESDGFCYYSSSAVCHYARNFYNGICYTRRLTMPSDYNEEFCVHGYLSNGACYYDRQQARESASSCQEQGMDEGRGDGKCYGSTKEACKFTPMYHNDICYRYRVAAMHSKDDCPRGFFNDDACYYDKATTKFAAAAASADSVEFCAESDMDGTARDGYCYGSSPAACRYTAMFHNEICYPYRLLYRHGVLACIHGYFHEYRCYYDERYESSKPDCDSGYADGVFARYNGFWHGNTYHCYRTSYTACRYARNFANNICYPYVYRSHSDACRHGHYSSGYCYSWCHCAAVMSAYSSPYCMLFAFIIVLIVGY